MTTMCSNQQKTSHDMNSAASAPGPGAVFPFNTAILPSAPAMSRINFGLLSCTQKGYDKKEVL
jgi:hypothetical protein